ncbi:MAG: hypothetical protein LCH99_10455, partial [Proteobacteria bacterium]|nr:hypothetical protein [Pseudomonadota bacterium]
MTKPITRVFEKFFGHPKSASLPVVVDAGGAVTPAGAPGATVPVADVIRPTKFNPATDGATSGRRKKRKPWNIARVSALFLVVVPSVASAVYFGFFASNQYSAKFQFAVRSNDRTIMPDVGIALPGMGNSSPVASDSYIAVEYLKSRQLIEDISKRIDLRSMYQSESIDWLSRLKPTAPIEDVVDYWQKQVDVRYEALSGIVFASVRAFSPENSLEVAKH